MTNAARPQSTDLREMSNSFNCYVSMCLETALMYEVLLMASKQSSMVIADGGSWLQLGSTSWKLTIAF